MYPGKWAAIDPDKAAAIDSGTGEQITFRELNDRSNQLAQLFYDRGLRRGDHIAFFSANDLHYFEVAWAALRSGLFFTTVNKSLTADEAGYIVNDCGAQVLVAAAALGDVAREIPNYAPKCHALLAFGGSIPGYLDYAAELAAFPAEPLAEEPLGSFMLYSSGTTGSPKGVRHPLLEQSVADDNAHHLFHQELWNFSDDTVYLSPGPIYHAAPAVLSVSTQALGGTVVLMPKFMPLDALDAIERYRVTHSQWVPTMFTRFLKLPEEERTRYDLSSHTTAIHAAAPCPIEVKRQMLDWWGPIINEYYAGTEAPGSTHVTAEEWLKYPGTVGKSMGGPLHVCDEDGRELPSGETGIIYFESEKSFDYHGDKGKKKDSVHPQHNNWIALGDVGYMNEEGYLFLTDRATFMIVSGGVNIYPQEVENMLSVHPKIEDVAVIGVPNAEYGEEVKAIVKPAAGTTPNDALEQELIAYARESLAHYKCPRSVDFRDELPRHENGKLYKRLLKDEYWGKDGSRIV